MTPTLPHHQTENTTQLAAAAGSHGCGTRGLILKGDFDMDDWGGLEHDVDLDEPDLELNQRRAGANKADVLHIHGEDVVEDEEEQLQEEDLEEEAGSSSSSSSDDADDFGERDDDVSLLLEKQAQSQPPPQTLTLEELELLDSKDNASQLLKRPVTPLLMTGPTPAETYYLRPAAIPGMPSTVCFAAHVLQKCWQAHEDTQHYKPQTRPKLFVRQGSLTNNAVRAAFKNAGYRKTKGSAFHTLWAGALKSDEYRNLAVWQTTNHFPGTWELGRKDRLYLNLARAKRTNANKSKAYRFFAKSFLLPGDAVEWKDEYMRADSKAMWIIKPVASSRGRGIRLVRNPKDVNVEKELMVQRYISDPHLIQGYKYDLRIYALITCFDPLKVYIYKEGLVRFATLPYTTSVAGKKERCVHLTNYSINSKQEGFSCGEENDDEGFKWTVTALRAHFDDTEGKGSFDPVWEQIRDVVTKTCVAVEPKFNTLLKLHVPNNRNQNFEIFGFDFLIRRDLTAHLIEVNTGPALMTPTPLDKRVKFPLVADMLHLVGFQATDRVAAERLEEAKRRERLTGIPQSMASTTTSKASALSTLRRAVSTVGKMKMRPGSSTKAGLGAAPRGGPADSSRPGTAGKFRNLNDARDAEFHGVPMEQLPGCVRELEEEWSRASETGWQPAFPLVDDPERHADLFETPRFANIILQRWLLHKLGKLPPPSSRPASRLGSRPSTPASRPSSRERLTLVSRPSSREKSTTTTTSEPRPPPPNHVAPRPFSREKAAETLRPKVVIAPQPVEKVSRPSAARPSRPPLTGTATSLAMRDRLDRERRARAMANSSARIQQLHTVPVRLAAAPVVLSPADTREMLRARIAESLRARG